MFEYLINLRPHFYSLREIKGVLSLDLILPKQWVYQELAAKYNGITVKEQQTKNDKKLVSFLVNEINYEKLFNCGQKIVNFNIEKEKKDKLFQEKIRELQVIFEKEDLETLEQNIKFQVNEQYQEPVISSGTRMVGEGNQTESDNFGERKAENS